MYQKQMACAIKVDGRVLREHGEQVFLPFGSEFSIYLKNLSNRRACATITIDGQDAVYGGLIINANSSVNLERFVRPGQQNSGNRFKFIERTEKVEEARGIKVEDGLIRIEIEYERENEYEYIAARSFHDALARSIMKSPRQFSISGSIGPEVMYSSAVNSATAAPTGITVEGSISNQQFKTVSFTGDGNTSVMVIQLMGEKATEQVSKPITVADKNVCATCKHVNQPTAKFCSECGTSLEIVPTLQARFAINDVVVCKGAKHFVKTVRCTPNRVFYGLAPFNSDNVKITEYESDDVYPGHILG